MLSNVILALTALIYLVMLPFNLDNSKGTGEQNVGNVIPFFLMLAYVVLSLVLTITITSKGGFNWISSSTLWRNVGTGVLWLGMMSGFVFCSFIKSEVRFGDELTGLTRVFLLTIYYGGVWLPLLMLLSYGSMLNHEWRFALSPNVIKTFLLLSCAIGLSTIAARQNFRTMILSKTPEYELNIVLNKIEKDESTITALYYIKSDDQRLRDAATLRISQQKDLSDKFQLVFQNNLVNSIGGIYCYWNERGVEDPERFVEPINHSITEITSESEAVIINPYKGSFPINIETMCRVLDNHFNASHSILRPKMLKLQEVLDMKPAERANGDSQVFVETLNTYRLAVKNWLDSH